MAGGVRRPRHPDRRTMADPVIKTPPPDEDEKDKGTPIRETVRFTGKKPAPQTPTKESVRTLRE
jgi:hypothetical protein